jgi:MFS family permease
MNDCTIEVRPRIVAQVCGATIVLLLVLHTVTQFVRFAYGYQYQLGLEHEFYLGSEQSLPNWFSSVQMLACAAVLLVIGRATRGFDRRYWIVLGLVFVGMSIDEEAGFHDLTAPFFYWVFQRLAFLGGPFHGLVNKPGYAWMVPGLAFTAAVGLWYWPFLMRLPRRTRHLFLWSGAVFVMGAVGFEVLGGWYSGLWGPNRPYFVMLSTCKEILKRVGETMFLYSLLDYAQQHRGGIRIRVGQQSASADAHRAI